MSKPIPTINRYKADIRELNFLLLEQFRLDQLLGRPPFEAWGPDECRSTLSECYRWVREVIGPLNALGDAQGCRLEGGSVVTPDGFKRAWQSLYEAGSKANRRRSRVGRSRRRARCKCSSKKCSAAPTPRFRCTRA